jgi:hypothetical protein
MNSERPHRSSLLLLVVLALALSPAAGADDAGARPGSDSGSDKPAGAAAGADKSAGAVAGRTQSGAGDRKSGPAAAEAQSGGGVVHTDAAAVGNLPPLQPPESYRPQPQLTPEAEVFMVTINPGLALYSTFGHTAIRIVDPPNGLDLLYNYGQSSVPFDASFVPRFVTGELPFMLGVSSTPGSYDFYRTAEDRSIYEQHLNLNFDEKRQLYRFLAYNALPQNRIYIYDFFFDNCTTRVRDLFSYLFGPALSYQLHPQELSFREEIAPYLAHTPFVVLGINLVFGVPADTVPQPRHRLFLPFQLRDAIASAQVDRGGGTAPLEREAKYLYRQQRPDPAPPPVSPALLLWLLAAAALLLTLSPARCSGAARGFDTALLLLVGLTGTAMALLWAFSGYLMTTANFNLLWAWPLQRRRWLRGYFLAAGAASAGMILLSPLIPQVFPAGGYALMTALALRSLARGALPLIGGERWLWRDVRSKGR